MPRPPVAYWPIARDEPVLDAVESEKGCFSSLVTHYHCDLRKLIEERMGEVLTHSLYLERLVEDLRASRRWQRPRPVERFPRSGWPSIGSGSERVEPRCEGSKESGPDSQGDSLECHEAHAGSQQSTTGHAYNPQHVRSTVGGQNSECKGPTATFRNARQRSRSAIPTAEVQIAAGGAKMPCDTGDGKDEQLHVDPCSRDLPQVPSPVDGTDSLPAAMAPDVQGLALKASAVVQNEDTQEAPANARSHWVRIGQRNSTLMFMNSHGTSWAQRLKALFLYDRFVISAIVLNAAFIGLSVQWQAKTGASPSFEGIGELIFIMIFAVELGVRLCAEGCTFFTSNEKVWNYFDFFLVTVGLMERLLRTLERQWDWLSDVSVLRIVRLVRIMRLLRIIRTLKFFRDLRIMVQCILVSIKSLTWVMCVLCMMFYIFGVALTQGANDYFMDVGKQRNELKIHFGALDSSMLSLYKAMAGGISWGELVNALEPLPFYYTALFLVFVAAAIYAVANVVTGVFVENAVQHGEQDRESMIQEELRLKEKYARQVIEFFRELDSDCSDTISFEELEMAFGDEKVVAYFNAMQLDIGDLRTLFTLMDPDRSGEIDIEEFITGCLHLKGEARSIDIAKLQFHVENITQQVENVQDLLKSSLPCAAHCEGRRIME